MNNYKETTGSYYTDYETPMNKSETRRVMMAGIGLAFSIASICALTSTLVLGTSANMFLLFYASSLLCSTIEKNMKNNLLDLKRRNNAQEFEKERNNEGNKREQMRAEIRKCKEKIEKLKNAEETDVKKIVEKDEKIKRLNEKIKIRSEILQAGCDSRKICAQKRLIEREQLRKERQRD